MCDGFMSLIVQLNRSFGVGSFSFAPILSVSAEVKKDSIGLLFCVCVPLNITEEIKSISLVNMGNSSSLMLQEDEIQVISAETGFSRNQIVRLYSRFLSLDKQGRGYLDRDDFLRIPELAINPLGDRIVDAFFTETEDLEQKINFREFIRVLAHFRPISKEKRNVLNSREEKLKCKRFDIVLNMTSGERMANQYRSLQTYYNSEAVLVAAGDDFLYSHPDDLETVYRIYTALFNYINRNYDRFHMKVQFGTVADYFNALNESRKNEATVLAGDFFPYMDDESGRAPFWTGFYNHRPYFKCFERIIQREFRLTDLLSVTTGKYPSDDVEVARRDLALSLHHDAITGTSRRRVMDDYTLRLRSALHILLKEQKRLLRTSNDTFTTIFINDSVKTKGMHLSRKILSFTDAIESYKVRIVNQKAFQTMELIKLNTSTSSVTVMHAGEQLTTQLVPLMRKSNLFENVSNNEQLSAMIIKGPVYSSIYQQLSPQLSYQITVINSTDNLAQSLQIDVFTNVISMPGNTFFMNLKSSIENDANFYTDINGLYLIDRRYDKRMKLEANIYPMVTEAMIEDDNLRCTILTAQTTGVTSKMSGTLQLMIDREVYNDDGKGLEYYEASESYPTHLKYRIIFEPKISMKVNEDERHSGIKIANKHGTENDSLSMNVSNTVIYHSQFVQQTMDELLYPAALFLSSNIDNLSAAPFRLPGLPDNIQLITARFIAYKTVLISMRQLPYDCSVIPYHKSNNNLDLAEFFSSFNNASIYSTNLTGTRIGNQITPELIPSHFTQPFEIISFIVLIN
ncbi:unnamed protein product [Litomosoides sigmodontis]|uniref:Glycoside hydrolase family 38 central domain-containing protein n=1 Tax=Litomosoides sigmodontis TaxID=42156 RepID=A0A3P6TP94_LITSI|nr:unnamed protein product [Litomosoides sigmodontis]